MHTRSSVRLALSQASGVPYYRQVKDQIAELVRAGKLAPGAPLPSVRHLAAELLVSVITVKKAYEELEVAGLVACHQGRGTFVAETAVAATRRELDRDAVAEIQRAIRGAARTGVPRATVLGAVRAALDSHYGEEQP